MGDDISTILFLEVEGVGALSALLNIFILTAYDISAVALIVDNAVAISATESYIC